MKLDKNASKNVLQLFKSELKVFVYLPLRTFVVFNHCPNLREQQRLQFDKYIQVKPKPNLN